MATFNAGPYLSLSVGSILTQTYADFELIIVDDGSTDGSVDALKQFDDARIRLLQGEHVGLVAALNLALQESRGDYIARMDADDIAHVDRLRAEAVYLDSQPAVGVVCSNIRVINEVGRVVGAQRQRWPDTSFALEGLLYARSMKPIVHPTVMMRRSLVIQVGGYRAYASAEDRDLWLRLIPITRFHRIQSELLDYRIHANGVSRRFDSEQLASSAMAVINYLVLENTGVDIFEDRHELFASVATSVGRRVDAEVLPAARVWAQSRSDMLAGRWFSSIAKAVSGSKESRRIVSPALARKLMGRIVVQAAASASSVVNEE